MLNTFYSTRASSTGAAVIDAVPQFEYYKVLRETELTGYRYALRGLLMSEGAIATAADFSAKVSRGTQRLVEDLRDAFQISEERHQLELEMALQDPAVVGVRSSGVAKARGTMGDALPEEPPVEVLLDAEDDGGRAVMASSGKRPAATAPKGQPVGKARPQPPPVGPGATGGGLKAPAEAAGKRAAREKIDAVGAKIKEVAAQLLRTTDNRERVTLRMRLSGFNEELEKLATSVY